MSKPTEILSIDPQGPWRRYTIALPAGAEPIGTVTRQNGSVGALVRFKHAGLYAQVNRGTITNLDQRQVLIALERPPMLIVPAQQGPIASKPADDTNSRPQKTAARSRRSSPGCLA